MTAEAQEKAIQAAAEASDPADQRLVQQAVRRIHRHLDDGIEVIGGIAVAAGICGYDRGDLRREIDRTRRLSVEHALAIGARIRHYHYGLATRLGAALVEPLDLCVFPRTTLTDKERADRLEAAMRAMPMGEELLSRVLGGTR